MIFLPVGSYATNKTLLSGKKKKIKPRGLPALSVLQNYFLSPQIQTQTTALERHF